MRLALVASGASLAGAGRGGEIDAHDGVMRLFDCRWQVPEDHGRVWSWGVIPGPWRQVDFARYVRDLPTGPYKGWFVYHFGKAHPQLPGGTIPVDLRRWNGLLQQVTGRPELRVTRGFAMFACAALLAPKKITAYGFDAIKAASGAGYRYHPRWTGRVDEQLAATRHDFGAERELIERLMVAQGMEIDFA